MAFKFITVSVHDATAGEAELNAFLGGHRVLSVERHWVDLGSGSFWAICIDYLPGRSEAAQPHRNESRSRQRVDYKEVLTPQEFARFAKLRDLRKAIAQAEAVPVYTVFTNEQLAQFVQQGCRTKADLAKIDGVGEAKIERYAEQMLDMLAEGDNGNETQGIVVPTDH
jgi:superfamily II DNA helicase RecQ